MTANPFLQKLGFEQDDRVVVIHADDVGMCQATIPAFAELTEFGLVTSGAVMVPCPWFLHAAKIFNQDPKVDLGVHLTLTSEWSTYRWGPLSTRDPASGLLDGQGYFHHRAEQTQQHAAPQAVALELAEQLKRALQAGLDVTHVDTHMGTLAHPDFISHYIHLARQNHLPPVILAQGDEDWMALGVSAENASKVAEYIRQNVDTKTLVQIDHIAGLRLDTPVDRMTQAKDALRSLKPGLTHFVIHPALDTTELREAAPWTWECRVLDYQVFKTEELRNFIQEQGIHLIGYRALRDLIRD